MNTMILILVTLAAVYAIAWTSSRFGRLIRSDGYGHRPAPRSHHDDAALSTWR